jgi:hypothetical protein
LATAGSPCSHHQLWLWNPYLLQASIFTLDFPALAAVLAMGLLLTRSTRKSTLTQAVAVGLNLTLIIFILSAGGAHMVWQARYEAYLHSG